MADGTNPIKYSDLISPDNSINDLIKQLQELSDTYSTAIKKIKGEAVQLSASLKNVSGATEIGRKATKAASSEADKLAAAQRALRQAESETAAEIAKLKAATAEQNAINKANAKQAAAAADSYDYLSAQYTKNKLILNKMSEEERANTKVGKELEAETKRLYERMNELQKATGKYTLQVGNYTIAGDSMRSVMREIREQMLGLEAAGQKNSKAYQELLVKAGELRDAMDDTNAAIKNMASDTSTLDSVLSAASLGTGGFAVATGAMELFGEKNEDVEEAQRKLQAAIALVNGMQSIQNALQKQSALMLGISKIQTMALAKAEALETAIKNKSTKATKAATVAMKAFNAVAKSNPIVLLVSAVALLGGAIATYVVVSNNAAKKDKERYERELKLLEISVARRKAMIAEMEADNKRTQQALAMAEAEGKSKKEILDLQEQDLREREQIAITSTTYHKQEIANLDANKKLLAELNEEQRKADLGKKGGIKLSKKEREALDAHVELVERQIEVAEEQIEKNNELAVSYAQLAAERKALAKEQEQAETDSMRNLQDIRNSFIKNQYKRERAQINANYARQKDDLRARLEDEKDMTEKQRTIINQTIVALEKARKAEIAKVDAEENAALLAAQKVTEDMQINLLTSTTEKEQKILTRSYNEQVNALKARLADEGTLAKGEKEELAKQLLLIEEQYQRDTAALADKRRVEEMNAEMKQIQLRKAARTKENADSISDELRMFDLQRDIELTENAKLSAEMQQSESDIRAKYATMRMQKEDELMRNVALNTLTIQQNLAKSEIDLMDTSEKKKTALRLQLEKHRLEKMLELNQTANIKMGEEEQKTIENQIAKIDADLKKNKSPEDIYDVLGLNLTDEQKEGINTSIDYAKQALTQFFDYKLKLSEQAVDAANREVEAAQNALNSEREARAAGYANNVAMAEKELAAAKQQQRKALKQQREVQKEQQKMQTIEQAVNMITATAKIFGSMPIYLAIPAIALMWGVFAASKIKAKQLESDTEQYGEGTVELLEGGSHASGNDIDLGTKKDGTRRRAEGGEYFAVINKRSSRKYRKEIPDLINALNNDTFADKYLNTYNAAQSTIIATFSGQKELESIANDMREIKQRGNVNIVYTADGWIERKGNVTRIIRN